MARNKLYDIGSQERHSFIGTFDGVGYKKSYNSRAEYFAPTLVLKDVKTTDGEFLTDHLWFNYGRQFSNLGELKKGDQIKFEGRVGSYQKGMGRWNKETDYKIERPTHIERVDGPSEVLVPDGNDYKNALVGYVMMVNEKFYKENDREISDWHLREYRKWLRNVVDSEFDETKSEKLQRLAKMLKN